MECCPPRERPIIVVTRPVTTRAEKDFTALFTTPREPLPNGLIHYTSHLPAPQRARHRCAEVIHVEQVRGCSDHDLRLPLDSGAAYIVFLSLKLVKMHMDGLQTILTHGGESDHMMVASVVVLTPEICCTGFTHGLCARLCWTVTDVLCSRTGYALGLLCCHGCAEFAHGTCARLCCDVADVLSSRTGYALGCDVISRMC